MGSKLEKFSFLLITFPLLSSIFSHFILSFSFASLSSLTGNFFQSWRNQIEELITRIRLQMDDTQDKDSTAPLAVVAPPSYVKYHSTLKVDLPKFGGSPVN